MSDRGLRFTGIALAVIGFVLWAHGFVHSSFWYANTGSSLLEPVRVWASVTTGRPIPPGIVEEIAGLFIAATGLVLQVVSYYWKKK